MDRIKHVRVVGLAVAKITLVITDEDDNIRVHTITDPPITEDQTDGTPAQNLAGEILLMIRTQFGSRPIPPIDEPNGPIDPRLN